MFVHRVNSEGWVSSYLSAHLRLGEMMDGSSRPY